MHTGLRWGFIFLSGKSDLPDDERLKLVGIAADMYFGGAKERQVSIDGYRGLVSTKSEWSVLGCFSGQVFYAEIWSEDGKEKTKLSFLISEQTYGIGRSYSMN
jgi:hypothetical protein